MKGIILAAGKGTRLYPITVSTPKPLLPIYDKPMLYYPLATLIKAGIKEIMFIVPPGYVDMFSSYFGNGEDIGIKLKYSVQTVQRGIADAFIIAEDFIGDDSVCLMLGDNVFYGQKLNETLNGMDGKIDGALCFGCYVDDPRPFGVIEFDENDRAVSLEEKPQNPKSHYIVPGMYFYDNNVVEIARTVQPSARGELEITSVNNAYLNAGRLSVIPLERDTVWFDTGTEKNMLDCANKISQIQTEQGTLVGCVEEEAYKKGYISKEELHALGERIHQSRYGKYILGL